MKMVTTFAFGITRRPVRVSRRDVLKGIGLVSALGLVGLPAIKSRKETPLRYRLGKKPAQPDRHLAHFGDVLKTGKLPDVPLVMGWDNLIPAGGFPMLLNDRIGDCAPVGALHIEQILLAAGKQPPLPLDLSFTPSNTAAINYAAITGYKPGPELTDPSIDNPTDQGTAIVDLMNYWRDTGLIDGAGTRHRIAQDLALDVAVGINGPVPLMDQVALGVYLFGAVSMGFMLPLSAHQQFAAGQPWIAVPNSPFVGGHFVPIVGRNPNGMWRGITWGGEVAISDGFILKYCDEAWVVLSAEMMANGVNPDGIGWDELGLDLPALSNVSGKSGEVST